MPTRIPGVPALDPVNLPMMSPGEAGRPGEAISQMGESLNEDTLEQQGLNLYIKKAQEHVDTLAARNQLDAAYAQIQNDLAKTQNSRDVPDVIQQGQKTLNDISAQWSKSPASIAIQMEADSLRPSMARVGTVRQVDLMGKELKINLSTQGERLAEDYASGNRDGALAAFSTAVDGGVQTGLLGDAEAGEYIRQFKQKGQELQIKNAITNASPEVNQKIYDEIAQHRDQFPDVTQEQLDTYKGQALSAFEAHTKLQDWAEGQMALKTQLVPKIDQFTNPATGRFDEAGAMTDNADRFAKGEITETQSKVLAEGFASHQAQLQVGLKAEAGKRLDSIEQKLAKHDFAGANAELEANQPWFENNGFGDDYRAALRYTSQKRAEVRAEASSERAENRYEYEFKRQVADDQSKDTFAQVSHFITSGGMLTQADLRSMAGAGKGKMKTADVDSAWKMMQSYEKDNDFAAGMDYIDVNFKAPKVETPDQTGARERKLAETNELFQQQVNANPTKSKLEIAHDLVKSANEQTIKDHADQMFGTVPVATRFSNALKAVEGFITSPFTYQPDPNAGKPKTPVRPKGVPDNYQWNPNGNGGKGSWKAPQ